MSNFKTRKDDRFSVEKRRANAGRLGQTWTIATKNKFQVFEAIQTVHFRLSLPCYRGCTILTQGSPHWTGSVHCCRLRVCSFGKLLWILVEMWAAKTPNWRGKSISVRKCIPKRLRWRRASADDDTRSYLSDKLVQRYEAHSLITLMRGFDYSVPPQHSLPNEGAASHLRTYLRPSIQLALVQLPILTNLLPDMTAPFLIGTS